MNPSLSTPTSTPPSSRVTVTRHPTPAGLVLAATHRGKVRRQNQDAHGVSADGRTLVLADGMGGHPRGAEASRAAVDAATATPSPPPGAPWPVVEHFVQQALVNAHRAVSALAPSPVAPKNPGSTVVIVRPADARDRVAVGWAGDSRLYLFWPRGFEAVTKDHVVSPQEPALTRGLGADFALLNPGAYGTLDLPPDATLLLTSDGLHSYVPHGLIVDAFRRACGREDAVRRLLGAALRAGAPDNVTVMLLRVGVA